MKKILFPTDFSTHSIDVLQYALALAKKFGATLLAMHAFGRPEFAANGTPKPIDRAEKMLDALVNFVEQFTKANNGKAFYSSLKGLGEFIFMDYKDNKRKRSK